MNATETTPPPYRPHGTDEGAPAPSSPCFRYRYRYATFGGDRVMVAGDLLEELEQRAGQTQ